MVIPILEWHSAAKQKSSTAAAPLIILQNPTFPSDWVSTMGKFMQYTSLSPCWSYRQFPKEYLKETCVLHIQQEKGILKGKRLRNERSKGSTYGGEKWQRLKAQIKIRGQAVTEHNFRLNLKWLQREQEKLHPHQSSPSYITDGCGDWGMDSAKLHLSSGLRGKIQKTGERREANHAGFAQRIQVTKENKMLLSEALILL